MRNINTQVGGRFKIIARKADGQERVVADWFDNLVLDIGLNRLGTAAILSNCRVGTGNSTPTATQTALDAQVAQTTNISVNAQGTDTVANAYTWYRRTYRFEAGAAAGVLAEVGVGWADVGATLFSRALIKDAEGVPTTITILSDEVLDVIYELRMYRPTGDINFNVTISGVEYACQMRIAYLSGASITSAVSASATARVHGTPGNLGAITDGPSGASGPVSAPVAVGAYVNNSMQRQFRLTAGLSEFTSSIHAVVFGSSLGTWQVKFTPAIPKTNANVLTLDFTVTWARKT